MLVALHPSGELPPLARQGQAAPHLPPLPASVSFLLDHGVPAGILGAAAMVAAVSGVAAEEVLIREGHLSEDEYYRALAAELGARFAANPALSAKAQYPNSILAGMAPARSTRTLVVAPRGQQILRLLGQGRALAHQLAITTPAALTKAVFARETSAIADRAAEPITRNGTSLSSRHGATGAQRIAAAVMALLGLATLGWLHLPTSLLAVLAAAAHAFFLVLVGLRLLTLVPPAAPEPAPPMRGDAGLPVYTVIVALYREKRVATRLVEALRALDYPAAKLDIKLVLEADDRETASALLDADLPGFVEIIVAPPGHPRTKPRALNVALPLARGEFTVIYDAEDVPDPAQLRKAVAAFRVVPRDVACLQARLTIENDRETWIARFFATEYAGLFEVINPGLSAMGLPIPLGGTSNHFRTAILQSVGGWDAWNVTEDADLGMRLARLGYRTGDLDSHTLEEAPLRLRAWMRQRTRWMKGFVQTLITHSRQPGRLWRELGPWRLAGAASVMFGTVASVLVYPVFTLALALGWSTDRMLGAEGLLPALASGSSLLLFLAGLGAMVLPALVAVLRRGLWHLVPCALLLPLYYGLVSIAAWCALWELWRHPFRWNKTEHGLARRRASLPARVTPAIRAPARPLRALGSG